MSRDKLNARALGRIWMAAGAGCKGCRPPRGHPVCARSSACARRLHCTSVAPHRTGSVVQAK
jgi:hypothetical protein